MSQTEAKIDTIKEEIRATNDTVRDVLITASDHGTRLKILHIRFNRMDRRLDSMENAIHEILTLVKREPVDGSGR